MRIHLVCDHKWRDLPGHAAMKIALESHGHRVSMASAKQSYPLLTVIRPDCVVLNHMYGRRHRQLAAALRRTGIAVVILPTEGTQVPSLVDVVDGKFSDYSLVDLFLSWNEEVTRGILATGVLKPEQVPTVGCTRFDFYAPPLGAARLDRATFCRLNDLDPAKPIITWSTKFGFARLVGAPSEVIDRWLAEMEDFGITQCLERIHFDPRTIPALHANGRLTLTKIVVEVARALPDCQFVIKPHPAEERAYYDQLLADGQPRNIKICFGHYIWDVLGATDILLHRHCTTAAEAWFLGLPTIELTAYDDPAFPWTDNEGGSDAALTSGEVVNLIVKHLARKSIDPEIEACRNRQIAKHFFRVDGKRTVEAAALIDALLRKRGQRRQRIFYDRGISGSPAAVLSAALRYYSVAFATVGRKNVEQESRAAADKFVTSADIDLYVKMLRPLLGRA